MTCPSLVNRLTINPAAGAGKQITAGLKSNEAGPREQIPALGSRCGVPWRPCASPGSILLLLQPGG